MNTTNKYTPALGYDWLSGLYDLTIKLTMPERKIRQKLIRLLEPAAGERILEFGFGTGSNLMMTNQQNPAAHYTGLEIDPKIKAIAQKRFEKNSISIPLDIYDGGKFPYDDHSFDKVYSCLVFHHLYKHEKMHCLREIYRVLKPGGTVIIADFGKPRSLLMRACFLTVQVLDGFETTSDNLTGLLPDYLAQVGFLQVQERDFMNTLVGSFSYNKAFTEIIKD